MNRVRGVWSNQRQIMRGLIRSRIGRNSICESIEITSKKYIKKFLFRWHTFGEQKIIYEILYSVNSKSWTISDILNLHSKIF